MEWIRSQVEARKEAGNTKLEPMHSSYEVELELDRKICGRSLAEFVKRGWNILEPGKELKWGWALDAMCEHLEAVTSGRLRNLLINVPPGMMKSRLVAVFWPAWEWGPAGHPEHRYLGTSHKEDLAVRDNMACRRLIQSEWYQERWRVNLTSDQNAKKKFENDRTGFREAMPFTSMTGSRGDRVILDDPHSVDQANSELELLSVRTTFKESLPTRVNDENSAIIIIMQRLNEADVSGIILEEELDFEYLMLPMRFEPERRCMTSLGFIDPRTEEGELLFPERFSEDEVERLEKQLGSYAVAGQMQQRPASRQGALFKRSWFVDKMVTADWLPKDTRWVRHWDLAATDSKSDKNAARTAGVKMGRTPDGQFVVADCKAEQLEGNRVRELILKTAEVDELMGHNVLISLPQDPGQAGKVQKQDYASRLAGRNFRITIESGDKQTRVEPFAAQCEAGNVYILRGHWNQAYLDELCLFPAGKWKDRVDATSGAFGQLVMVRKPKTATTVTRAMI